VFQGATAKNKAIVTAFEEELGHEVIVIPDQDEAGLNLIKKAMEYGWSVAFPTWDNDVKDVISVSDSCTSGNGSTIGIIRVLTYKT